MKLVDDTQLDSDLTSVANAIRGKTGGSVTLTFPADFVSEINGIPTGITPSGTISITSNGSTDVTNYATASVNVSPVLTPVAIRPDAEVWKSWTVDRLFVADDGGTIPAYTTSATTLVAAADLETINLSFDDYGYFASYVGFVYPIYNTSTIGKARQEFGINMYASEVIGNISFHPITGSASAYLSNKLANTTAAAQYSAVGYWDSASSFLVKSASYGLRIDSAKVNYTNGSVTIGSPIVRINGNATYLSQTYFGAITDFRYQYAIKLWRVPKNSLNTPGWSYTQIEKQIADAINSASHTLT